VGAAAGRDAGAGIAGGGEAAAGAAFDDFDDFDDAGGVTGALGAGGDAGDRAPRGCAGVGAGGGDSTIVGSRSLLGGVRGTLGNAPPRAGVRGSGGAAGGGGSSEEEDEGDAAAARSPARRGSRCEPGHSQIEREDSTGVCGIAVLAGVANAGVSPGAVALYDGGGAGSSTGGAGAAGAADAPVPGMSSGSSFIALPSSSPAEASAGLPS